MSVLSKAKETFIWHYSDVTQRRSDAQEERERKFLGLVPFHRLMLLPAAVLVQLCVGSLYAWSVNNIPIEKYVGATAGTAANTFYVAVGCFGPSAALFGPWLERHGPRTALLLSSTLFFLGNMCAALSVWQKSMGALYFSYGVIGGFGLGLSYITPVSPLQKWFPDYRGVVSGMAVCGFGGGSMIAAKVQNSLINSKGVPLTFIILGSIYFVIMMACTFVLRTPPEDFVLAMKAKLGAKFHAHGHGPAKEDTQQAASSSPVDAKLDAEKAAESQQVGGAVDLEASHMAEPEVLHEPEIKMTLIEAMFTTDYRLMYFMLMANAIAGLLTISKLSDICQQQFGKDADLASTVVSVNSGFNLTGRVMMGLTSDFFGRKPLFMVSLVFQAIIVLCAPTMIMNNAFWPYVICMWFLSAFYGGGFGLIPAFLADQFGTKNIGALHGIILTAWSFIGVVGGLTFNAIYKNQVAKYGKLAKNVYNINYYWIAVVIWLGVIATPFIHTDVRDRLVPAAEGQFFCIRVGKRLLRVSRSKVVEYLTHQQEETEWRAFLHTLPENQPGYKA
eukprot:comp24324_c1_seq16/m.45884 comp24324_c1_seq16/g.45884  ORF comp24324_c1_seq16/g.45884 comp24324_c1_seq16/m.45884 type:complete len:559 (-) comp24324_c1_seq16:339-2015(-)